MTNEGGEKVLRMYWLDAYEDPFKHPGTVWLFGKVSDSIHVTDGPCFKESDFYSWTLGLRILALSNQASRVFSVAVLLLTVDVVSVNASIIYLPNDY